MNPPLEPYPVSSEFRYNPGLRQLNPPTRCSTTMTTVNERFREAEKLKDSGQVDGAKELLLSIIEETPDHVLSHLTLARIYTQTGEHLAAVQHAEEACRLEPNEAFNFTILSVTYQKAWAGTQDTRFIRAAEDAMARSQSLG